MSYIYLHRDSQIITADKRNNSIRMNSFHSKSFDNLAIEGLLF